MCTQVPDEAKEGTGPLELEVQVVVSQVTWVLGTEFWFSAKAPITTEIPLQCPGPGFSFQCADERLKGGECSPEKLTF